MASWNDEAPERIHHPVQLHPTGLPTYVEYVRADLLTECVEILDNLAKGIREHGHYSEGSMLTYISSARSAVSKHAPPPPNPQGNKYGTGT